MRRALVVFSVLALTVVACGKKGLPPECDQYLAKYDCYMTKQGMLPADRQATLGGMRSTWTTTSSTSDGRKAALAACQKMDSEMVSKFAEAGCK